MGIDVYQMVTDRIITMLEQGSIPWDRPWTGAGAGLGRVPRRHRPVRRRHHARRMSVILGQHNAHNLCYTGTMEGWGDIPGPYFCLNRQCVRADGPRARDTKSAGFISSPRRLLRWRGRYGL